MSISVEEIEDYDYVFQSDSSCFINESEFLEILRERNNLVSGVLPSFLNYKKMNRFNRLFYFFKRKIKAQLLVKKYKDRMRDLKNMSNKGGPGWI